MSSERIFAAASLAALVALAAACSPPYAPEAAQPAGATGLVIEAGTSPGPAVQASPTALPPAPPSPTWTPLPLPTPTLAAPALLQNGRIQFPPGGTWAEVDGWLEAGGRQTYVLAAMRGQVMSVSVREAWPFTVSVADASRLLSDPNFQRPFWRGGLPAGGDYYVTVEAAGTGSYTLRVAINPPGQARQFFEYRDPARGTSLRYSDEFAPLDFAPPGEYRGQPVLTLALIAGEFLTPVTNLGEAYLLYNVTDGPAAVASCSETPSPQESPLEPAAYAGYEFTRSEVIGAGAGNRYHLISHRTAIGEACYEFVFYLHSGNIGNYPPGTVREYDHEALIAKFEAVLDTFRFE